MAAWRASPRTNMAVLMGSQLPVGWHVQLRIIAIRAMTSRDRTVAEHSLAVWRLMEGGKISKSGAGQWEAGHTTCRSVIRGFADVLGITKDFHHRRPLCSPSSTSSCLTGSARR